jgi:hypothetical protein
MWKKDFNNFFETQMILPVVISDPLHPLKRNRFRLPSADFRIGVNGDERDFAISAIQIITQIPQVVFDNSSMTKMHDSLSLHLFSKHPIIAAFKNCRGRGFCLVSLGFNCGKSSPCRLVDPNKMPYVWNCLLAIVLLSEIFAKYAPTTWNKREDPWIMLCHMRYTPASTRRTEHPL